MVAKAKPKQNQFRTYADYLKVLKAWKRTGPKKKPRRVVLGVGHPWFSRTEADWTHVSICVDGGYGAAFVPLNFDDLGNYNRIRLVAEVLK